MWQRRNSLRLAVVVFAASLALFAQPAPPHNKGFRGVLLTVAQVDRERLRPVRSQGAQAVVLNLAEEEDAKAAAGRIRAAGFDLYYWIEIGRSPRLADAHPEWMASLQGHPEWRRFFPSAPLPKAGEVVKNYPWVPIMYQEAFDAHRRRVARLLADMPEAKGVFLNDLQGAPSACGCGNNLCRWTSDYGPIKTATRLGTDAAAQFVAAVGKLAKARVIPIWTTECQEHESAKEGRCAGVPCFAGTCWREYTKQLMPVVEQADALAALVPYKAFDQDLPSYGPTAGWVKEALSSFVEMPPKRQGKPVAVQRVIAVLQGWDVTPAEVQAQIERSEEAGAAGYVISLMKIEQSWEPKIFKIPAAGR